MSRMPSTPRKGPEQLKTISEDHAKVKGLAANRAAAAQFHPQDALGFPRI